MFFLLKENEVGFLSIIDFHYSHSRMYGEVAIKNLVLDNECLSEVQKNQFIEIIKKKKYERYLILKYFHIWKRNSKLKKNRNRSIYNECDLELKKWDNKNLNKLEVLPKIDDTIIINNYRFRLKNLKKMIETSLRYIEDGHVNPQYPKNPYTNKKMDKSDLIRIYKKIYKQSKKVPIILRLFEENNFDIRKMLIENENYFNELDINNKLYYIENNEIIYSIKNIFRIYNKHVNIESLRRNRYLKELFRPILKLYFKLTNSNSQDYSRYYRRQLKKEFDTLLKLYPYFDNSYYALPILYLSSNRFVTENNKRRRLM